MIIWQWIDKVPKVQLYPEPKRRVRFLTIEQLQTLLKHLPKYQRDIVLFALSTGLRRANITGFEWSQVDLGRKIAWIHPDQAKAGESIAVPLNGIACATLHRLMDKHPKSVFTYQGKPIKQVSTKAWRKALVRAGIINFRWHDLRHTWASWLAMEGARILLNFLLNFLLNYKSLEAGSRQRWFEDMRTFLTDI